VVSCLSVHKPVDERPSLVARPVGDVPVANAASGMLVTNAVGDRSVANATRVYPFVSMGGLASWSVSHMPQAFHGQVSFLTISSRITKGAVSFSKRCSIALLTSPPVQREALSLTTREGGLCYTKEVLIYIVRQQLYDSIVRQRGATARTKQADTVCTDVG
jgi:hypothetical protein